MCGQVAISRVALTSCDGSRRRGRQSSTQSKVSASLTHQPHACCLRLAARVGVPAPLRYLASRVRPGLAARQREALASPTSQRAGPRLAGRIIGTGSGGHP